MRHLEGGISDFSCLLSEDGTKEAFLRCQLCLSLGSDLTDQDIACTDFRTHADDAVLVQILEGILADTGNVPGDLFGAQLGISGFAFVLFDMNRCIYVVSDQSFAEQDSVLVVVALPGHETDQRVLAQGQLAVAGGRTVCDDLAGCHTLTCEHDGLLVVAVGLVASLELGKGILILSAFVVPDDDGGGVYEFHNTAPVCQHADTGVNGCLGFHTGTDGRSLGGQKRNGLTLHVGTHQGTVRVIVLQERNQGCSNGEDHSGRDVHVLECSLGICGSLCSVTAGHSSVYKAAVLIQLGTRLSHMVVIFFIRSHVDDFVRNAGILRIGLIDLSVRCLYKAVFIDPCKGSKRVDQTDVGTFGGLNGAHSSVVCIVDVSYLESGTVS